MGNKPSLPPIPQQVTRLFQNAPNIQSIVTAPTQVSSPPPPPIPVCDANCERQKRLTALKQQLDIATANRVSDPEAYQRARLYYYSVLEGPEWWNKEKERIGLEEVGPAVSQLNEKYQSLINEKKNQASFLGLLDVLRAENDQNKQELKYIYDQTAQNTDIKNTVDRMNELGGTTSIDPIGSFYPLLFQALIAILSIIILVLLYRRFVPPITTPSVPVGGKRLPH